MRYYLVNRNSARGFDEVTEDEYKAIMGDETTRPYASKVYRGKMTMEEVPEEYREAVSTVVAAKVARWGEYNSQPVTGAEMLAMAEEVVK